MAWGCVAWSLAAAGGKKMVSGRWVLAAYFWRRAASGSEMPTRVTSGWEERVWKKPHTWSWLRPTMATRIGGVWAGDLLGVARSATKRLTAMRNFDGNKKFISGTPFELGLILSMGTLAFSVIYPIAVSRSHHA